MATTPQRPGSARQKSWALMPGATVGDVGGGEVGRRGPEDGVAETGQAVAEQVALGGELGGELGKPAAGKPRPCAMASCSGAGLV